MSSTFYIIGNFKNLFNKLVKHLIFDIKYMTRVKKQSIQNFLSSTYA